ncbi:MAG: hypothetical protein AAF549_08915 [Pseudomonadota bacterium]
MIRIIGLQKVLFITILIALAGSLFFYESTILSSQINDSQRDLRRQKAELSTMTKNTQKLSKGIELFQNEREVFQAIEDSGFFDVQNRIEAREKLEAMRVESRLLFARYNIKPAEVIALEELEGSGYSMLSSDISFDLGAIDDSDIYSYIYLLNHGFPGEFSITSLDIVKEQNVTQPLLRNIGVRAQFDPLVKATMNVKWRTMVKNEIIQSQQQ